jgi:hypothetical protein
MIDKLMSMKVMVPPVAVLTVNFGKDIDMLGYQSAMWYQHRFASNAYSSNKSIETLIYDSVIHYLALESVALPTCRSKSEACRSFVQARTSLQAAT